MEKIVFILGNYKNGGMAMQATNLSNAFAKRGYSVDILVTKELDNRIFFFTENNVHIISIKEYNAICKTKNCINDLQKRNRRIRNIKCIRRFTKPFRNIDRSFEKKIKMLRKGINLRSFFINNKPNIVIPFGIPYLESSVSAAEGINCKIFYAEKNAPEIEFPQKGTDKYKYFIDLLKQLRGVIVQTENEKEFFKDELNNVFVINNPIKQNLPLPYSGKRKKTIVNFCRMSPQKNIELLIEAFSKLHDEYPEYILQLYGNTVDTSENEYKERIKQKIKAMELDEYVHILPPVADVHQRIVDCAMFVSTSHYEGLSNSMIEAMAIGLPCICTDCLGGGTREVMVDSENGIIVPMNDVDALCNAMKCFIEHPDFAEQCGQNASKIRERLAVEKIAQEWLDVFQR